MQKKFLIGFLIVAGMIGAIFLRTSRHRPAAPLARTVDGPLTVAAVGDIVFAKRLPSDFDPKDAAIRDVLATTDVSLANLEVSLLAKSRLLEASKKFRPKPFGSESDATQLVKLGFNVLTLANNHAADYGAEGVEDTGRILDSAGLAHAGSGSNLDVAQAPLVVGQIPRHVAILAVAISSSPESRATHPRTDINGRAGVSAIKYRADIKVDPKVYAVLKRQTTSVAGASSISESQLSIFGASIEKGTRTTVDFRLDQQDVKAVLQQIQNARQEANVVVLAIHSHEPRNQDTAPAEFVRDFAHAAIDAGATLIIGSGPHQLRGIEIYKNGAILYSLGNFVFDPQLQSNTTLDIFDSAEDLFGVALGAVPVADAMRPMDFSDTVYWESVIAIGQFEDGLLQSIRLIPIDLGIAKGQRGIPHLAGSSRAAAILQRLAKLSVAYSTDVKIGNSEATINLRPGH